MARDVQIELEEIHAELDALKLLCRKQQRVMTASSRLSVLGGINYALPSALPASSGYSLVCTDEGIMSWAAVSGDPCFTPFDSNSDVAVSVGVAGFLISSKNNGKSITAAIAAVHTTGTTGTTDIMIRRRRNGVDVDVLSLPITIGTGVYYSSNGTINSSNNALLTGDLLYVDVTSVTTTPPQGLSVIPMLS